VFSHLVSLEVIDKNPITTVRFPNFEEKPRDRYLTPEERLRLLNAIREHRPYILPIVQYMLAVPCRVSELTTARREQYNPFTQTIYIPDSKAGIPIHKPIPPEMVEYFQNIPSDCDWLFYRETSPGEYRPLNSLRCPWAFCLKRAGLADLHVHDLRHISATDLYEAGNPEMVIAGVAGWKTPDMLSRYYHKDSLRSAQRIAFKTPQSEDIIPLRDVAAV
jgi:integrase